MDAPETTDQPAAADEPGATRTSNLAASLRFSVEPDQRLQDLTQ
jgi:hypothetical protein